MSAPRTSGPSMAPRQQTAPQTHAQPHTQQPYVQQQQPGLFGQMASTAAGVAVGSTVGHGISNMLFGGRSEPAPAYDAPPAQQQAQTTEFAQPQVGINCDAQSKDFLQCLEKTNDMNACSYYLEQLKACQAAARPY
ncbi:hypothetical protein GLX27_002345 [Malassezia furfur]|uniref:Mitochondrial intermembrane space cysteine motif-containing protein MIX17 n=1 Tax=Malassezia furfur TaxID=55194 RepID=A0ABY8ERM6_MALFU|nr:hypothetical protein GLX27_002345 [Malassezia furfur]